MTRLSSIYAVLRTVLMPWSSHDRDSLLPVLLEASDDFDVGGSRQKSVVLVRRSEQHHPFLVHFHQQPRQGSHLLTKRAMGLYFASYQFAMPLRFCPQTCGASEVSSERTFQDTN
jgi:hypothetical protein